MAKHNELGKAGEEMAANLLISKGYEILERQWRYKHKEIDIIAKKGNTISIVEVKTRSSEKFGTASDFITENKMDFLAEAAEEYVESINFDGNLQFDVVVIFAIDGNFKVEHIENAFVS